MLHTEHGETLQKKKRKRAGNKQEFQIGESRLLTAVDFVSVRRGGDKRDF